MTEELLIAKTWFGYTDVYSIKNKNKIQKKLIDN